jgi:predicted amidohydrolase YtcJ
MFPVYRLIGGGLSIAASEKKEAIWNFGRVAQLAGVTTATDLVNDFSERGNQNLRDVTNDPAYPLRIVPAFAPQRCPEGGPQRVLSAIGDNTDKLRFGPVKFIVDGSIQGFTARLKWPGYLNGKPNGLWLIPPSQFVDVFAPFHEAGLQLHIHTNGDEATELVLDALEKILDSHPRHDHRHTLQHCQMADASQLARAAKLGLCSNFFSNHLYYWGDAHYEQTMGADRANRMDAAESARRLGIPFAFHSDAPITPLNPLFTAWCASQRETSSGRVLGASERVPVADALRAITLGAAYTLKMDHLVGSIEVGKFADFAVLEEDPNEVAPERLKNLQVWGTVLGGRIFQGPAG